MRCRFAHMIPSLSPSLLYTQALKKKADASDVKALISALELSGLAFIGLVHDPDYPELGAIMRQNQQHLASNAWFAIWPGALLSGMLAAVHLSKRGGQR